MCSEQPNDLRFLLGSELHHGVGGDDLSQGQPEEKWSVLSKHKTELLVSAPPRSPADGRNLGVRKRP